MFEISHAGMSSSVASGGRYDNLIGHTHGRDVPAFGFSIGSEHHRLRPGHRDTIRSCCARRSRCSGRRGPGRCPRPLVLR
ncbi:ATP phosphoribosyltransferase regulatory subunit [Nocardia sp. NPDC050193]